MNRKSSAMVVGDCKRGVSGETGYPAIFYQTAIMVDAGWMTKVLQMKLGLKRYLTADEMYQAITSVLQADELLYRLYYYDSAPFDGIKTNPISKRETDFSMSSVCVGRSNFFSQFVQLPCVALRLGTLNFRGWTLAPAFERRLIEEHKTPVEISANDIRANFEQKGVDMRIGIDIASLAYKRFVHRIILFSGDTDMIPAMKLARTEGVQLVVIRIGSSLSENILRHADLCRELKWELSGTPEK